MLTHRSLLRSMALLVGDVASLICGQPVGLAAVSEDSYLVDPASSHMLVSKIKPCMSKYKLIIL